MFLLFIQCQQSNLKSLYHNEFVPEIVLQLITGFSNLLLNALIARRETHKLILKFYTVYKVSKLKTFTFYIPSSSLKLIFIVGYA